MQRINVGRGRVNLILRTQGNKGYNLFIGHKGLAKAWSMGHVNYSVAKVHCFLKSSS